MAFNLFVLGRARSFTVYICFKEALFFTFSYKLFLNIIYVFIIKLWKSRTCAVMGSSGRDCVLIKAGFFEGNLFWVGQFDHTPPPPTLILGEKLIQY